MEERKWIKMHCIINVGPLQEYCEMSTQKCVTINHNASREGFHDAKTHIGNGVANNAS